ncbi:MAG TPA: S8 family serine peptidase [Caulobacteraceae bacterium]|nr:S8 family serine peptidase [Caulobacteraceae bacterium]
MAGCLATAILAAPAGAQRLGGLRALDLPLPTLGAGLVQDTVSGLRSDLDVNQIADLRLSRLRQLVRDNPKSLETDDHGAPVVRGEVLAVSPTAAALQAAEAAGFVVARRERLEPLGLDEVVLSPPQGQSARQAVRRLRKLDPEGQYDFDHIYSAASSGPATDARPSAPPAVEHAPPGTRVGLLDTGFSRDDPAFAGAPVEQQAFAPGGIKADAHGTAVASLIVGQAGRFHGAAPGARLYAADVYGTGPAGGSADAIVRALAWMAREGVPVINVSLVGPPNLTLEAAVRALNASGALIVAPVGNDGPAAPPLYPASYPGVVAVTAVDRTGRVIFEAGRAKHVDFAAPGADMVAEKPGGGLVAVRGTSFASPIVAGRLAVLLHAPDPPRAARALNALSAEAGRPGGEGGRLGLGVVGEDVRLDPKAGRR